MIALPAQSGGGPFRYFQMLLKKIAEYELIDVSFIIYKAKTNIYRISCCSFFSKCRIRGCPQFGIWHKANIV